MVELCWLGIDSAELKRLNKVQMAQQVLFMSDVLDARGTAIDKKYLTPRLPNQQWSSYSLPIERPPKKDFRLWNKALFEVCSSWRGRGRMGRFVQQSHKIWNWRYVEEEQTLYHIQGDTMDVYTALGVPGFENHRNCWSQSQWDVPTVI